jgi:hypothetical protein
LTSAGKRIKYIVEFIFSRHAKRRMKWRKLNEEEIKKVVLSPDRSEPSVHGRTNVYKKIGAKLLKVTYIKKNDKFFVVSAVDKNK